MHSSIAFCILTASLGLGQIMPTSTCASVPSQQALVTIRYTPRIPAQIPPISTVYNELIYRTVYGVDCKYLAVERVDDNPPQTGKFTSRTTISALTIDRVTCITEMGVVTRRDVRGYPDADVHVQARDTTTVLGTETPKYGKRDTMQISVLTIADKMSDEIPPDAQALSVRAYNYMVQVNTALYCINLYNTGFNMSATCAVLSDPVTQARLMVASINPSQAAAIICYAAQYGLFFDRSNAQLLSDLLGVIYSIEVKSGFTTNTTELCNSMQLGTAGFLGIDAAGIRSYVCGDTTSTTSLPLTTSANTSSLSVTGLNTIWSGTAGTAQSTGTVGSTSSGARGSAGPSPPYANSTAVESNSKGATPLPGSVVSASTISAGPIGSGVSGVSPTIAASDSYSIVFPNATSNTNASIYSTGHVPPSPLSSQYYAIWTTSTTIGPRMPKY